VETASRTPAKNAKMAIEIMAMDVIVTVRKNLS
jgi:hypothetical protein